MHVRMHVAMYACMYTNMHACNVMSMQIYAVQRVFSRIKFFMNWPFLDF